MSVERHELQDVGAETADRSLLDRHNRAVRLGELREQLHVERFHEPSIRDGHCKVWIASLQFTGGEECRRETRPERQYRDLVRDTNE